jgi:hypothetical protein
MAPYACDLMQVRPNACALLRAGASKGAPGRRGVRKPLRVCIRALEERGDIKAGYPALSYVGYEAATRTVEYAGFVARTPLARGGEDPRFVLVREIHDLRALIAAKKDAEGRPVDTVRIVFPHEWMARQERRPLLDAGARVFYIDPKADAELVEMTD